MQRIYRIIAVFNGVNYGFTAEYAEIAEIRYRISAISAPSAVKSFISGSIHMQVAIIFVVILGFALPRPASAQTYSIEDLGALEGTESRALGINAYGQVVGSVKLTDGTSRAFRYTDEDGMALLGTFITTVGVRPSATGAGINNSGLVVGAALKAYVSRTNHDCAAAWPDITIQDVSYNCASSFFSPPA